MPDNTGHSNETKKSKKTVTKPKNFFGVRSGRAAILVSIISALFTGMSVMYSHRQFDLEREIAHKELRAYIVFKDILMTSKADADTLTFEARFVNAGHTPAYKSARYVMCDLDTVEFFERSRKFAYKYEQAVEGPNIDFSVFGRLNVSSPVVRNAIETGKVAPFVNISIRYEDIFGEEHFTIVCFRNDIQNKGGEIVYNYEN
jgi:hypothetical protein